MQDVGANDGGRGVMTSPLLEREREVGRFAQVLDRSRGAASGVVVVEGPAGIGKSRLISELRDRAVAEDFKVLLAVGSDLEREFPFGVVRQLFEPLLAASPDRDGLLAGAASSALSVFESVTAVGDEQEDASFAALHGLYWLTMNAAAADPLILAVDDLHWCDRPSLRFLTYLARRLEGSETVLVMGLRTADPGTDPVMIGELVSHPNALHLQPGPLSETGIAALIGERLMADPDREFVVACRTATGGNPLLLRQLLSSLASDRVVPEAAQVAAVARVGPRAVSRTVLRRLWQLPEPAAPVAQAIAILGHHAELRHVAALCGLGEEDVARATAALAQAEILTPDAPLRFVHPLVRDAVYHQLSPGERELRHSAAADVLMAGRVAAEAVATQLAAAPRRARPEVVQVLREAAATARRQGAADSAVAYLQRALEEPPDRQERLRVLLELGLAETLTSGPAAAAHLREAWESTSDPRERAHLAATLARTLIFTAPAHQAREVIEQALAETTNELVDERQALRALRLMAVFFGPGGEEQMADLRGIEIEGEGPGARMLMAIKAHCLAVTGAGYDELHPLAQRALAGDVLIEADPGLFPPAAIGPMMLASRDEAIEAYDHLRERAHRRGSLLGMLTVGLWRGATLMWRGELREAEESLETALDDFTAWGLLEAGVTYGPAFLGAARLRRGKLAAARELLDPSKIEHRETDGYRHLLRFWCELLLAEGRHDAALAVADDLSGRLPFMINPSWAPWRSLKALALDGLGRRPEALELAHQELENARRFGCPEVVGPALSLVGRLRAEEGLAEEGLAEQREAVALLESTNARYDLAGALLTLGGTLRRSRKPTEAREPLRRALELADRCGAEALVQAARTELHAAGARPRTTAQTGASALTASERRVADLAAAGKSNREIAQTLYITLKTVEVHLSNAYRKLGIRSRQELPQSLRDTGSEL